MSLSAQGREEKHGMSAMLTAVFVSSELKMLCVQMEELIVIRTDISQFFPISLDQSNRSYSLRFIPEASSGRDYFG